MKHFLALNREQYQEMEARLGALVSYQDYQYGKCRIRGILKCGDTYPAYDETVFLNSDDLVHLFQEIHEKHS